MYAVIFSLVALAALFAPFQAHAALGGDNSSQATSIDKQLLDLKRRRDQEKMLADQAGRDAERYISQDWLSYRRALQRQHYLNHRVEELDKQINELEKEQAGNSLLHKFGKILTLSCFFYHTLRESLFNENEFFIAAM